MKRILPLFVIAALGFGQSFFNTRGLGQIASVSDARVLGLGSPLALSYRNPGILVHLDQTSFNLSAFGAGTLGEESGNRRLIGNVRPAGFHAAVPLPLKGRLLLGLDQRFDQDYDVWSESLPETPYLYHITGRGGLYALRAGLSVSLFDLVCVGGEYNHLLGSSRELRQIQVTEGNYVSSDTVAARFSANTFRVGAAVQLPRFSAAAFFEPGLDITVNSLFLIHGSVGDSTNIIRLPYTLGTGASFLPLDRFGIAAGVEYRPWSGILVDSESRQRYRDALRVSVGTWYDLAENWPIRLGYSYEDWYLTARAPDNTDDPIQQHAVHLGTSIPIPKFGSLDIGTEIARRETQTLTETAARLMLSLSYHEAWNRRTRRWGY
jgi:opacity protein-like surface antigen